MKVDDLINRLIEEKKQHGNIEIVIHNDYLFNFDFFVKYLSINIDEFNLEMINEANKSNFKECLLIS